jgi:hypothetical protein
VAQAVRDVRREGGRDPQAKKPPRQRRNRLIEGAGVSKAEPNHIAGLNETFQSDIFVCAGCQVFEEQSCEERPSLFFVLFKHHELI